MEISWLAWLCIGWYIFIKLLNITSAHDQKKSSFGGSMEDMAALAKIYYSLGSEDIRRLADKFFKDMDGDRDGRVSLPEYLTFMARNFNGPLRDPKWFHTLDKEKKGGLGFDDVLPLFYMLCSGRPFCMGCGTFVGEVYFTCVKCFDRSPTPFSVCLQCYDSNKIAHNHEEFLDNFALLEAKRTKPTTFPALKAIAAKPQDSYAQGPKNMKQLRRTAMAYCRSISQNERGRKKINEFVDFFLIGNHERVALHEFLEFMSKMASKEGRKQIFSNNPDLKKIFSNSLDLKKIFSNNRDLKRMSTSNFFNLLDKDEKGLDSSDVKTFYYIIRCGRPFCSGCSGFIMEVFFTCVHCFTSSPSRSFHLCRSCIEHKKYEHNPEHRQFLDSYAILEALRVSNNAKRNTPSDGAIVPYQSAEQMLPKSPAFAQSCKKNAQLASSFEEVCFAKKARKIGQGQW